MAVLVFLRDWCLGVESTKHSLFQTRLSALQPSNIDIWAPVNLVPFVSDPRKVLLLLLRLRGGSPLCRTH